MFEVSKLSGHMLCERVAEAMRRNKPSTVVMGVGLPGSTSGCGRALLSRFGSVNSWLAHGGEEKWEGSGHCYEQG